MYASVSIARAFGVEGGVHMQNVNSGSYAAVVDSE